MQHAPWVPPLVEMSGGQVGHLLEWRQHERDGSWHAWVSWVLTTGDPPRHQHKVVSVQAQSLAPLEEPDAYRDVPRRVLGNDGKIRPWSSAGLACDLRTRRSFRSGFCCSLDVGTAFG
jgi:hypothetical protein